VTFLFEKLELLEEFLYTANELKMQEITIKTSDLKALLSEIEFLQNLASEILSQTINYLPVYSENNNKLSFEDYVNWLNYFKEAVYHKMFLEKEL